LKKSSIKKTGYAPLMVRITINGESAPFSLKAEAKPDDWDTNAGRLRGRTKEANDLNAYLDEVRSKTRRHYRELCDRESVVTAEMVKNAFLGLNTHKDTLLCLFDQHNENYKTLVGKQTSIGNYRMYVNTRKKLYQFLKQMKNKEDICLKEISPQFIADFERFLFVKRENQRNTVMKSMRQFKRIVVMAHNNGLLSINPFASYEFHYESTDRGFLSEKDLISLMNHSVECPEMEEVRDVFVFCCFTGLSHIDVSALREEHIQQSFDGQLWVMIKRQKTNVQSDVRLLPIPLQILEKYKGKCEDGMLLPVLPNWYGNKLLKELGKQCGISTKVTFHLARHTFATTVTLSKGVPIESVSKMLGHTSVKTTQIYARIVNNKVSSDMDSLLLSQKLSNLENVFQRGFNEYLSEKKQTLQAS
jgi:site-specific recombinase XerD